MTSLRFWESSETCANHVSLTETPYVRVGKSDPFDSPLDSARARTDHRTFAGRRAKMVSSLLRWDNCSCLATRNASGS